MIWSQSTDNKGRIATQAVSKRKEYSDNQIETFSFSSANCLYLNKIYKIFIIIFFALKGV